MGSSIKNGQIAQRDPELDTQTVTDEKINPDGTTTKTVRKEVRKPGNSTGEKYPVPPPEAVEDVRKNPALKSAFYAKYGQENADKALGGGGAAGSSSKKDGGTMLQSVKPPPDYRPASDGSGRMVDVTTGRTLTAEQSAVLAKIERGEPTTPGERALLNN